MASGYLPPHKRKEIAKEPKAVSMTSKDDFPDLSLNTTKVSAWGSKTSFSQKIKDLIANEKKTDTEREAEKEAARAIEGWAVLDIRPFTKERYILFNERLLGLASYEDFHGIKVEPKKIEPVKQNSLASPNNEPFVGLDYDSPSEEENLQENEDHFDKQSDEPYEDIEEDADENVYIETYDKYY